MSPVGEASLIVLAGGRSLRIGRDKASIPFGAVTMLERIVAELAPHFTEAIVVDAPASQDRRRLNLRGARVVHDPSPFRGALAGLIRGLDEITSPLAFACACDLPLIKAELARALCSMLTPGYQALVPVVGGRLQPLVAVYRKPVVEVLRKMAEVGERRLQRLFQFTDVGQVAEAELRKYDPGLSSFINVNTPADLERALLLARVAPRD